MKTPFSMCQRIKSAGQRTHANGWILHYLQPFSLITLTTIGLIVQRTCCMSTVIHLPSANLTHFRQRSKWSEQKTPRSMLIVWNVRQWLMSQMTYVYTSTLSATMHTGIKIHQNPMSFAPFNHSRTRPYFEYHVDSMTNGYLNIFMNKTDYIAHQCRLSQAKMESSCGSNATEKLRLFAFCLPVCHRLRYDL